MKPRVSVIVPVFNTDKYLAKCLNSLVKQSLVGIEIIIVNDGSTDNSQQIIEEYAGSYKNIKYFKQKNYGTSGARNFGISKASGDYIGFVDSDDTVDTRYFENLYMTAVKTNSDLVMYRKFKININEVKTRAKCLNLENKKRYSKKELMVYSHPLLPLRLYRKSLFSNLEFPSIKIYEDVPVAFLSFALAKNITVLNRAPYNYRTHAASHLGGEREFLSSKSIDRFKALVILHDEIVKRGLSEKYFIEEEAVDIIKVLKGFTLPVLNLKKSQRKVLVNLYLNYLDINYPNWEYNKYFLKGIDYTIWIKGSIKTLQMLSDRNLRKYKTNKRLLYAISQEIKKINRGKK